MTTITSPEPHTNEEERLLQTLRPTTLDDFIGQNTLRERFSIGITAARMRGVPLEHALFSGPPGTGKTSLANIIATEMGGNLIQASGTTLENVYDLLGILTRLSYGDVFFIDEVHQLDRALEESLYTAMEDFRVDFVMGAGIMEAKPESIDLQPFTLVAATTRKGMLSAPLRERFGLDFTLSFYDVESLALIVKRSALLLKLTLDDNAIYRIAERSRGTPRIANRLLRRVMDFAIVHQVAVIDDNTASQALQLEGIDNHGMDELDRRYLSVLKTAYKGGPAGVNAIAATLQDEPGTLTEVVEPYLLHKGFIARTSSGRRLTEAGMEIA